MHEYHTGVPGSFAQTTAGLLRASEAGLGVGVTTVVTRSNFRHMEELTRLAHRCGASAIQYLPAVPLGSAAEAWERVVPERDLMLPYLASAVRAALALGLDVLAPGLASGPGLEALFAGLGETEPSVPLREPVVRRPGEAPSRRPAPGLREVRQRDRLMGEALRPLFPGLFEPAS
jgi:hypothetical protein